MLKCRQTLLLVIALGTSIAANPAHARGVGLVLDVQGPVLATIGTREMKLEITSVLEANGRIQVGKGERISFVFYPTKEQYRVEGPSVLAIGTDAVKTVTGTAPIVKKISEERTQVAQVYSGRMAPAALVMKDLPGNAASVSIVYPRDGDVLLDSTEEFRWSVANVGTTTLFRLFDGDRKLFEQVAPGRTLTLPGSVVLMPGQHYRWTVSDGVPGSRIQALATFSVASVEQLARLRRLQPDEAAPSEEWVLYGVALEEIGASGAAQHIWKRIVRMRPDAQAIKEFVE